MVVEHLQFVGNNEGHDATSKTLLEHQKATYTTITVLEGMDTLEANMEVEDV